MPNSWTQKMITKLEKEKQKKNRADFSFAQNLKFQIREYEEKLDKLLDLQLSGAISTEEYTQKKQKILNQKIEISEKLRDFEKNENGWLERARNFILTSNGAKIIAHQDNLQKKREFLQKVGSNIVLADQNIKYFPRGAWKILENLPDLSAKRRRRETRKDINFSKIPVWLRG